MDFQYNNGDLILYEYTPNQVAAGIFMGLFGIGAISHFAEMCRLRTPFFIPLIFGCIMEVFGYYGRFWNHSEIHNFGAFCLQSFMLLLGPIFIAATMYMSLSRIALSLDRIELLGIRRSCSAKLFILGDIVTFIVQIAGLGLRSTTSESVQETGRTVIIIGLIVQILLTAGYLLLAWKCYAKVCNLNSSLLPPMPWRRYLVVLLVSSGCLLLRNLVRTVEYAEGATGFVATHEVFIYLFDGLPMVGVSVMLLICHPSRLRRSVSKLHERFGDTAMPMVSNLSV